MEVILMLFSGQLHLLSRISKAETFVPSSGIETVISEHRAVFSSPLVGQAGTQPGGHLDWQQCELVCPALVCEL